MDITCKKCGLISTWDPDYMKFTNTYGDWEPSVLADLPDVPVVFRKEFKKLSCLTLKDIRKYHGKCPCCQSAISTEFVYHTRVLVYWEPNTKEPADIDRIIGQRCKRFENDKITLYVNW